MTIWVPLPITALLLLLLPTGRTDARQLGDEDDALRVDLPISLLNNAASTKIVLFLTIGKRRAARERKQKKEKLHLVVSLWPAF